MFIKKKQENLTNLKLPIYFLDRFTNFFSWKGFQVSTKLSYAIYLTQFPIFFYNVGRRRHIHHYYNFVSIIVSCFILRLKLHYLNMCFLLQLDTNEYICIFLASVVLTVLFDAPFQNIKKILIKRHLPSPAAISKVSPAETISSNGRTSTFKSCDEMTLESSVKNLHSD